MSLVCPVGPEGNLLAEPSESHCERLNIQHPVLTLEQMETLKSTEFKRPDGTTGFKSTMIDITFPVGSGPDGMIQVSGREEFSLKSLCTIAVRNNEHILARLL